MLFGQIRLNPRKFGPVDELAQSQEDSTQFTDLA